MPGLVCRKAFFILPFDKRFVESNTLSEIGMILLLSLLLQFSAILVVAPCYEEWNSSVYGLLNYLNSMMENEKLTGLNNVGFKSLFTYQIILWWIAAMIGLFCNSIIRYFKLDRKTRIFRLGNSWYYYFSGEAVEFPDVNGNANEIDVIFVDILVKAQSKEILYIGVLSDYELSANGGLKSIALKGAKRRYLLSDRNADNVNVITESETEPILEDQYYTIPSNLLIIPYNDSVINMNIRYYADDEEDKGGSDNLSLTQWIVIVVSLAIVFVLPANLWKNFRNRKAITKTTNTESPL